jgi:quinol monooxygenase YgiN
MSVIMILSIQGDPEKLEQYVAENPDHLGGISEQAKEHGLTAHRFYGSDGQIMVVDEWPDAESFQRFYEAAGPQIQPVMEAVGVTSEPTPSFWRKLDTKDEVGWDA